MFCCWNLSSQLIYSYGNVQKLNVVENVFKFGLCLFFSFPQGTQYGLVCHRSNTEISAETDDRQVRMKSHRKQKKKQPTMCFVKLLNTE